MPPFSSIVNNCIEPQALKVLMKGEDKVKIIDIRTKSEFDTFHINEAIHIDLAELSSISSVWKKDTLYVVTCGKGGGRSMVGANHIISKGYNARWLCRGTMAWN